VSDFNGALGRITIRWREFEKPTLVIMGLAGVYLTVTAFVWYANLGTLLSDAHAYWLTGQDGYMPYTIPPGAKDAFLYSPAFAQLIAPITWLPWAGFATIWLLLEGAAFVWLLRPLGWAWTIVLLLWCAPELMIGNIVGFVAVATVLALSGRPASLAFLALTKPALVVVAFWFVARREYRALAVAAGATLAVVAASVALDPSAWAAWITFLLEQSGQARPFYMYFLIAAIALVIFAARTDRAWLIPFALVLATPVYGGSQIWMLLAGIPRLARVGRDT
jgi:Glycosyltransferase family 87